MIYDLNQRFNAMHGDWIKQVKQDDCPAEIFIKMYREPSTNAHYYLKEGLKNPNLCKETLDELAHSGNMEIIKYVAVNPNTSRNTLKYLYDLNNTLIRIFLANNNKIYHKLLNRLLHDKNSNVVLHAISNKNTTFEDIESLINSKKYVDVLSNYIENTNNSDMLEKIYRIKNLDKQYIGLIAGNEATKTSIIDDIIEKYDDIYILKKIISCKNSNRKHIVAVLKKCPSLEGYISGRIKSLYLSDDFIKELINLSEGSLLYTISTFSSLSAESIEVLYNKVQTIDDKVIQKKIFYNLLVDSNTPTKILRELSKDIGFDQIIKVLDNPNCPRELFEKYYNQNEEFNRVIAKNPKAPIYMLEEIYNNFGFRRKRYLTTDYFGKNLDRLKQHLLDKQHNKFKSIAYSYIEEESLNDKINNVVSKENNISKTKVENIKEVFTIIESLKSTLAKLEQNNLLNDAAIKALLHSIQIPKDILLVEVNDHYEINSEFIDILKYINFKFISTENLKVSNIDFRDTNIEINPQLVYMKDLSNSLFDDENIFGSFDGVNLCGADISKETFLIDIDKAIIDENTKLPKKIVKER